MNKTDNMFTIENLSLEFDRKNRVFNNVNLELNKHHLTVLTGSNGSGKTTFCRLITGLNKKYTGNIYWHDHDLKKKSTEEICSQITYLKQEPAGNIIAATPQLDLRIWTQGFTRSDSSKSDKIINKALKWFKLDSCSRQPVWELSGGQLKRVGLSALLIRDSEYWILDEPFTGLDEKLVNQLLELIDLRRKNHAGTLVITHKQNRIMEMADRILKIEDKQIKDIV